MSWHDLPSPLLVIVGPTAVGKTETAISLAEALSGEIVSADSRYFYRGMDIGTAKPSLADQARVKHHLIDVAAPDETWNLAIFQAAAKQAIFDIHQRGCLPILVGGTGQYVQAVLEEWEIPAQEPDHRLRDRLTTWGEEIGARELHRKLALIDPTAATKMDSNNLRRIVRALEVIFFTGQLFSDQQRKGNVQFQVCQIGLRRSRAELYKRIDQRVELMLQGGLLQEMEELLRAGFQKDLPAFSAIGYREMIAVVEGRMTMQEAEVLIKRGTRQFVRRQANWFKESDPAIHWFDLENHNLDDMLNFIRQWKWE